MLKSLNYCRCLKHVNSLNVKHLRPNTRHLSMSGDKSDDNQINHNNDGKEEDVLGKLSFAKAFDKFEKMSIDSKKPKKVDVLPPEPFPTLLRHSPLMQLGDPDGKVVVGKVVQIVEDDLYIDFGGKFNAVCRRPKRNQRYHLIHSYSIHFIQLLFFNTSDYVRGAKVKIRINDIELSERFLGSTKDMTLLESDAILIGIIWSPARNKDKDPQTSSSNVQELEI